MLGRALILYLVIETSQEHSIALESRSGHGRNSLLWVENGSEMLVVRNEREPPPIEVHMEPFHPPPPPHTLENASLSIWANLRSVLVNDREAKATGLSLPSGMTCERTVPMPVGEASHASLTGNTGS